MSPPATLLSVDWGTSRLRLRLVQCEPFQVLGEVASDDGVSPTFAAWQASGEADRETYFLQRLQSGVQQLEDSSGGEFDGLPAVVSGMASSSIGMRELPYARAPVTADAASLRCEVLPASKRFSHPLLLVSGVATEADVMRGEETQLAGLLPHGGDGVYVLPGTHSKHVKATKGRIITFRTYVTGELFALIAKQSVLVDCVEVRGDDEISPEFVLGVEAAARSNLLHEVFAIRARTLVGGQTDKRANADYLSGLLIGSELVDLRHTAAAELFLAATGGLLRRYQSAIETLGLSDQTVLMEESIVDEAAARGHVELFRRSAHLFT